jgi:hypothetical protein
MYTFTNSHLHGVDSLGPFGTFIEKRALEYPTVSDRERALVLAEKLSEYVMA